MLKVLQLREGGCFSYIVYDDITKESMVVDPILNLSGNITALLSKLGLKTMYLIDTHTHADHPSGSTLLKRIVGGKIALSEKTLSQRADYFLRDGEYIHIGKEKLKILYVPGHTVDHIALASDDFVLTGDTLHVGTTARTDFDGSSAEDLYHSIKEKLFTLADHTIIYPGHDYSDYLFSTIAIEKQNNKELQVESAEAFVELKSRHKYPEACKQISKILKFNKSSPSNEDTESVLSENASAVPCSISVESDNGGREISPEEAYEGMKLGIVQLVDVRESTELQSIQYPSAMHAPLSNLASHLQNFDKNKFYYFACKAGSRSLKAHKTFLLFGIKSLSVKGGMIAWTAQGLPVVTRDNLSSL